MKKAKILSLLIMVLLVAAVFASLAFTSMAATPADPADADDFLDVVWTDETKTQFTLKGVTGGPWDATYADPVAYPFVVLAMPTADKGTANAAYSGAIVDAKGKGVSAPFKADLLGSTAGAVGMAKDHLKSKNLYKWNKDASGEYTGTGYYNSDSVDAYIFLRSNYTVTDSENYGNLAQVQGNLYIDMRNFTITSPDTRTANQLFLMECKPWGGTLPSSGLTDESTVSGPGGGTGDAYAFPANFIIKNGTFSTAYSEFVRYRTNNNANEITGLARELEAKTHQEMATKSFEFENVTFKLEEGATADNWFASETRTSGPTVPVKLILNGCTFITDNAPSGFTVLSPDFNMSNARMSAEVRINGGEIKGKTPSGINFSKFAATKADTNGVSNQGKGDDTMYFGTYNGEYIKLTFDAENIDRGIANTNFKPSALKLYTEDGIRLGFTCESLDYDTRSYELTEITANTFTFKGVSVSIDYASVIEYPFIVLGQTNGGDFSFQNASTYLAQDFALNTESADQQQGTCAIAYAKNFVAKKSDGTANTYSSETGKYGEDRHAVIYFRSDYELHGGRYTNDSKLVDKIEGYNNWSQIAGYLTIDLDGHILSQLTNEKMEAIFGKTGVSQYLVDGDLKTWTGISEKLFPTHVTLKNGTINLYEGYLARFNATSSGNGKYFEVNVKDVTVNLNGSKGAIVHGSAKENQSNSTFLNLTNCTINAENCTANEIFHLGTYSTNTKVNIKGGEINLGDKSINLTYITSGEGALNFSKHEGAYTTLTSTNAALNLTANDGKLTFKAASTDGTTTTYVLVPTASIGLNFTPKASVTLDSNLIFNIYLPEQDGVTIDKVTLDGKVITLGAVNEGYYLVATPLAASESAEELKLVITLTVDGTSLNGSFTFSTVKYAEKLLTTPEITLTEKMLAKDMLAYVNSAYVYFNGESVDKIDTLLDGYVATNVIDPATAKQTTTGLNGAAFVLDSAPAIRFYFDEALANAITFKVGERVLTSDDILVADTDEIGYYVEFSLYAYEMTGVFSYTIAGSELSGEYNLVSYYNYAGSDAYAEKYGSEKQAELVDLVAKFYSYCASAAAYRNN